MGLFWDLMQHNQLKEHEERATDLEGRVVQLERELTNTRRLMWELLERLEVHFKVDIDGDGRVG